MHFRKYCHIYFLKYGLCMYWFSLLFQTWNPKAKAEPYAKSVMELMNLAKKTVQEFFQFPIEITEDLVQELANGLQKIFKEYTMFVAACGKYSQS